MKINQKITLAILLLSLFSFNKLAMSAGNTIIDKGLAFIPALTIQKDKDCEDNNKTTVKLIPLNQIVERILALKK